MALIKCPECGKEKVSDSAIACPECGYNIKAHFEKIKKNNEKQLSLKSKTTQKENKEKTMLSLKEWRIQNVSKPEKPIFSHGIIAYTIIAILFFVFVFLGVPRRSDVNWLWAIIEMLVIIFLPAVIYCCVSYFPQMNLYKLSLTDFRKYQETIIEKEDIAIAKEKAQIEAQLLNAECPYCHSHNTEKITAAHKAINTAMFGVLGQKRKYQWHCNDCKSDF